MAALNLNYPVLKQTPNLLSATPTVSAQSPCERADQWKQKAKDLMNTVPKSWDLVKQKFSKMFEGGGGGNRKKNIHNFVYRPANNKTMRKYSVRRKKGGSAHGYRMLNDVASNAAPISGIQSASPHQWTRGGGSRRRRRNNKTRRSRRY